MRFLQSTPLNHIWLKASVIGSIWASFEIILGSFLHNLKIPLSGTILSLIGVWILIAFQQIWKEKGLVWRAGLICALMKSISPSAIILGPMIGIMTEALIIELLIRVIGRNYIAFLLGGGLAVFSTLVQKIISLLILYGFNLVKILEGLYKFSVKQIGMEDLSPYVLVAIISAIYIIAGFAGATGGIITGKRYSKIRPSTPTVERDIVFQSNKSLFGNIQFDNYSIINLVLNFIAIILILLLLNLDLLIPAGIIAVTYVIFCISNYKNSLKRLKKPGFWISFLLITFGAAFIWNWLSEGIFFTMEGFMVGLKMNARAAVLIIGFASLSVELRNPVIKSVLYNKGFTSLYQSLSLSFSALPYIISAIASTRNHRTKSGQSLKIILKQADDLYNAFEREHSKKPSIVVITGEIHQGKTTFAGNVINILREKKVNVCGFLAVGVNENGERTGFNLLDLKTGEYTKLCTVSQNKEKIKSGKYFFSQEAIKKGKNLLSSVNKNCGVVFIDEIGPLELAGSGWSNSIDELCMKGISPQVWIMRKSVVDKALRRWYTGDICIFDISHDTVEETASKIEELISREQK